MERNRRILVAKVGVMAAVVPLMIWGYNLGGPDAGHTGAPGDRTCAISLCHVGTPTEGGIEIDFPQGNTYTPGVKQLWTVRITGAQTPAYGFQATARLASDERTRQAGAFNSTDGTTHVLCHDNKEKTTTSPCRPDASIEFIVHTMRRTQNSFTFEWTPPATDSGNVRVYVAANAANANGAESGDRIFLANFTLTPQAGPPPATGPQIRSERPVLQAFSSSQTISPGTWIEIHGANLSATTRDWQSGDFNGDTAPTSLDGVSVKIDGKAAFLGSISPTMVKAQVPDGIGMGSSLEVELTNASGRTTSRVNSARVSPAMLATPAFNVGERQFVAALHSDFSTFVGRTGLISGVSTRPAKPGDTISIYAVGCGATNPASPAGVIARQARPLASPVQVRFGSTTATATGFLSTPFVGLCRIDTVVPNVADGDTSIVVTIDGVADGQNLFTNIQR